MRKRDKLGQNHHIICWKYSWFFVKFCTFTMKKQLILISWHISPSTYLGRIYMSTSKNLRFTRYDNFTVNITLTFLAVLWFLCVSFDFIYSFPTFSFNGSILTRVQEMLLMLKGRKEKETVDIPVFHLFFPFHISNL